MKYSLVTLVTAGFLFLLPLVSTGKLFYGATNSKFFLIILVIDLLSLWLGYKLLRNQEKLVWRQRWLLLALLLVVASHYASAYFGVFFEKSLWSDILRSSGVLFLTHVSVLAWLLGETVKNAGWSLLRRSIALSAGVLGFISIISVAGLGLLSEKVLWIPFSIEGVTFGNSTYAGAYLLLAIIVGLIEYFKSVEDKKWRRTIVGALVLAGISPIMFNTGIFLGQETISSLGNPFNWLGAARASSATMFALLVFLGGWLAIKRYVELGRQKYVLGAWSTVTLVGALGAVVLLFIPGSPVQEAYISTSTEARILVWNGALESVKERPYFGWGPENYVQAHEKHLNNNLYLQENIGEIWFDRAHNIVVDTLVSVGYVGAFAILLLVFVFWSVVFRAYRSGFVGDVEAMLLSATPIAHFLQLQTGFDTVATYLLSGLILGYVLHLERKMVAVDKEPKLWNQYLTLLIGTVLIAGAIVSSKYVFFDELTRQRALLETFQTEDGFLQRELAQKSLSQTSDWETLRLSSASFLKGAIAGARGVRGGEAYVENVLETAKIYEGYYERYLEANPSHYRARMNYAYLLIIETTFGERRLEDARIIIKDSYDLSPDNPLTPALHAIVFLYGINFDSARARVDQAIDMNPEIKFSQSIDQYVERQISRFPRQNTLLELNNL